MLQLFAIIIVGVAHMASRGLRADPETDFGLRGGPAVLIAWGSAVLVLLLLWIILRLSARQMDKGQPARAFAAIDRADRAARAAQVALLMGYTFAVLIAGWGATVERWVSRDIVLVGLVVTILPPILGLMGVWSLQYGIVRRLREAALIRQIDAGEPIYPIPSRKRFVLLQLRLNVLFTLAPLLIIVAAGEVIDRFLPPASGGASGAILTWNDGATFAAALGVFALAPLIARFVLDVRSMPQGPIRRDLEQVCADQRVRVRDILLWQTDGSMINGAVMGLAAPVRYVMLTDALVQSLSREQVLAVMAHEIGHVRRRHMPWLVAALFGCLLSTALLGEIAARKAIEWLGEPRG